MPARSATSPRAETPPAADDDGFVAASHNSNMLIRYDTEGAWVLQLWPGRGLGWEASRYDERTPRFHGYRNLRLSGDALFPTLTAAMAHIELTSVSPLGGPGRELAERPSQR